jgi:hypothetical protein
MHALPPLFAMKRDLLSLQIGDQLFGAINRDLIGYSQQQPAIPLNPFINLDAFFTHHIPPPKYY